MVDDSTTPGAAPTPGISFRRRVLRWCHVPHRPLDPFGRAATALADDLDSDERRSQLRAGLESLAGEVAGLRGAREALRLLLADADLAWKAYATSLLAEALAEE